MTRRISFASWITGGGSPALWRAADPAGVWSAWAPAGAVVPAGTVGALSVAACPTEAMFAAPDERGPPPEAPTAELEPTAAAASLAPALSRVNPTGVSGINLGASTAGPLADAAAAAGAPSAAEESAKSRFSTARTDSSLFGAAVEV